jgi:chloramphenicol O-acetyltransferase type A
MRVLDLRTWSRREQFQVFSAFDQPHFGLCANVDLTTFRPAVKQEGVPFTVALVYVLARAANALPEFRYRIRAGTVVEHEIVHPSFTLLVDDDHFSFCTTGYFVDFCEFAANAAARMAYVKEHPKLKDEPGQDNLLFMTALPWVSFTSFAHPMRLNPADSVPRFAWGKYFPEGDRLTMPLSVQGHHALMDGIHVARYYERVQELLDQPDFMVGGAPEG